MIESEQERKREYARQYWAANKDEINKQRRKKYRNDKYGCGVPIHRITKDFLKNDIDQGRKLNLLRWSINYYRDNIYSLPNSKGKDNAMRNLNRMTKHYSNKYKKSPIIDQAYVMLIHIKSISDIDDYVSLVRGVVNYSIVRPRSQFLLGSFMPSISDEFKNFCSLSYKIFHGYELSVNMQKYELPMIWFDSKKGTWLKARRLCYVIYDDQSKTTAKMAFTTMNRNEKPFSGTLRIFTNQE